MDLAKSEKVPRNRKIKTGIVHLVFSHASLTTTVINEIVWGEGMGGRIT